MRAKTEFYRGKSIYYMDFSGMSSKEEIAGLISESAAFIRMHSPGSLLTLTNISEMRFNSEIKELFTSFVKGNKPYVKTGAVVGISGMQSFMYNAVMKASGRNLKSVKSIAEAKDWIIDHSKDN